MTLDCKIANSYMMKYLDNNLTEIQKIALDEHLKTCDECMEIFNIYSEIADEEIIQNVEIPEKFELEVMEKIESIKPKYLMEKHNNKILSYAIISFSSIFISIISTIYLNKDFFVSKGILQADNVIFDIIDLVKQCFEVPTLLITNIGKIMEYMLPILIDAMKYNALIIIAGICIFEIIFNIKQKRCRI